MTTIDDAAVVGPRGTSHPLAATYDVGLLDLDGVVYLDGHLIPSAPAAVAESRECGMRFAFVTNNASRTPHRIAGQLAAFGIPATAGHVVTSAQAAARLVADRVPPGAYVLVVGAVGLRQAVREVNLRPVTRAEGDPAAVVQGYHPHLSYGLLAEGALAVRRGAVFVASNADTTMPTPRGPLPGNGAMARVIAAATGREPLVAGKPELPLHREAESRTGAARPLVIGDRLDTDIEGAVRAGTPSLLVLTGVTHPADLVTAPPRLRPTYLAPDLGGLLDIHPRPHRDGGAWWCRGWRARNAGGALRIEGRGDAYDGLRALCAAGWSRVEPADPDAVAEALARLGFG